MSFQSKTCLRMGAVWGSVIGIWAMIAAVTVGRVQLGAALAVACAGIGSAVGNRIEKRKG